MNTRIDPDDVVLLRRAGLTEEDLAHSIFVASIAGELLDAMPKKMREGLDGRLAVRGALFHDLGKVVTSGITHGEEGARIGRELGLPQEVLAVMVKHVRAGVPPDEATHGRYLRLREMVEAKAGS